MIPKHRERRTMRWLNARPSSWRIGIFCLVWLPTSALYVLVSFAGNMAGTGVTVTEAWMSVGIYTAVLAPAGFYCLGTSQDVGGPLRFVPWIALPMIFGLSVDGAIMSMSRYTAAGGARLFGAAEWVGAIALLLYLFAKLWFSMLRVDPKPPNQPLEPTPRAVTPPAAQEPRQP